MINSINLINFAKTYSPFKSNNRNNQSNYFSNINTSRLAPLTHDSISFTSKANLNKSLYDAFDNKEVCRQVSENAKKVETKLERTLREALKKQVYSEKSNPHGAIMSIATRAKTGNSIREKLASELEYAITEDKTKVFNPNNPEEIKTALGDIVGARITLRKSDVKETSKIIDSLITEVKEGRLKITKIENYEPKNCDDSLRYFNYADLERLRQAANEHRAPGQPEVLLKTSNKESGYMALHIDVDLSDENLPAKFNNYKGEIQIVGRDVEKLKEVEDFLYKLHKGMTIRGGHGAYQAFCDYYTKFSQLYDDYPNLKEDMKKYTAKAYAYQRKKEPIHSKNHTNNPRLKYLDTLPTIAQCGMQGKIPEELDFNTLAKIKKLSDGLYELTSEAA